ncbi:MAG: hypothetical protein WCX69_04680 [Candidatus Paceibacterota bacterium]
MQKSIVILSVVCSLIPLISFADDFDVAAVDVADYYRSYGVQMLLDFLPYVCGALVLWLVVKWALRFLARKAN